MIFKPSSLHKFFFTYICPRFYGDAPKMPSPAAIPSTTTSNINSIPEQLMPNVKTLMGAADTQIYQTNAQGQVTGFQPYVPYSTNAGDYIAPFSPLQQQAQQGAADLQVPGQFAPASQMAGIAGIGQLGTAGQALNYGAQGAGYGQNAANVGAMGGLGYGAQSANLGMQAAGMAGQGYGAGAQYAQQATDPNSVSAYMSPYMQNVMEQQGRELNRNYDISGAQQQGQATQAGAFGGSREALMASENERNRNMALNKMQAEGMQNAYTAANANQQFGANLGLQGMQAGNQAMQTGLQGIGQGITGVNTALQGYQQGMAGSQAGLQGVQGAQQGYAGMGQAATQLGQLGTEQLAAQTGVLNTQNTIGGQQQAQQQQAINQAVLNYQNAQQYPYMQLGFMSDLIRGTPTGNTTQTQYQAQPGMASQIGGLAATGLGAYAAMKADGGIIEDKGYKSGGIVGYKDRGYVEESMLSKLEDLDKPRLAGIIQKNESPEMTGLAKEVYATKLATGGIVAFADKENKPKGSMVNAEGNPLLKKMLRREEQAAPVANKTDMGIGARSPFFAVDEELLPSPAASTLELPTTAQTPTIAEEGLASPTGIAGVPEAPGIPLPQKAVVPEVSSAELDAITAQKQIAYDEAKKEADISIDDRVQQRKDLEERFLGKDTGTEDYRADLAKQKADAPDELRQMMGMRLMEFGANWASTPGAPLVAGMKALRETMPSVMKDTKEHKAMMKDLDKSTYMLEHAVRLEAMGQIDAAAAEKEKAAVNVMKHEEAITTLAVDKYKLDVSVAEKEKDRRSQESIAAGNNAATLGASENRVGGGAAAYRVGQQVTNVLAELKARHNDRPEHGAAAQAEWDKKAQPYFNAIKTIKQIAGVDYLPSETSSEGAVKSQTQAPPTVGEVRDGYKYNGGAYDSESSWSKI